MARQADEAALSKEAPRAAEFPTPGWREEPVNVVQDGLRIVGAPRASTVHRVPSQSLQRPHSTTPNPLPHWSPPHTHTHTHTHLGHPKCSQPASTVVR
ncbi:unnamed protein product [Protopolystoma xenopodis]|uniref:Uncharacterized protein n=1 Tax=Protopolystoma xenopodis TaxID=117903 RepID=A0A3S5CGI9_9PLAT|nr:unnamed protein product [Protopolystoma xenopodis]